MTRYLRGAAGFGRVRHPPFGELAASSVGIEAHYPQIAVDARRFLIGGRARDDRDFLRHDKWLPLERGLPRLFLASQPAFKDFRTPPPGRSKRLGVVESVVREQGADLIGIVRVPRPDVPLHPLRQPAPRAYTRRAFELAP